MLGVTLKNRTTPSILSLTRQNLDPLRLKYSIKNKCTFGAYEIFRSNRSITITILASGSEVNLAKKVCKNLAEKKIFLKLFQFHVWKFLKNKTKIIKIRF